MKRIVFVLILALFAHNLFAQESDAFAKANQEYAAGRFREAIDLYQNVVRAGGMSAALFYDLANAYYRVGDFGAAILNYERALALEPHHPEAEANLRLVRENARALELKRSAVDRIASAMTVAQYTLVAAVCFWVAAFAAVGLILARRRSAMAAAFAFVSLAVFALAVYAAYALEDGSSGRALAIVTAKGTEARLATADNAGTVLALPPGSEIKILSTRGDWIYASLPNDLRGWIPAGNAERVRL